MSPTAEQIGNLARVALDQEARFSPKPGLVDAENCGAHTDMDLGLLLKSAEVIKPYFARFAAQGMRDATLLPDGRLSCIRADGREGEAAMFAATGGINTHKGALFLLGVLCYSAGHCVANGLPLLPETLCQTAARVCSGVTSELGADAGRAYIHHGARGARGEAEDGFPHALEALSAFASARERGASEEDGWRIALLGLIFALDDANVLARCGQEIAQELRNRAGEIAAQFPAGGDALSDAIRALNTQCLIWHASPGGAADVLACAMFLHRISDGENDSEWIVHTG